MNLLKKTAQQALFTELRKAEINSDHTPVFNGYDIDGFGYFQNNLNTLFLNFELELSDNLTSQSPGLELYLSDITGTISRIHDQITDFRKEEIFEIRKNNPDAFKMYKLGYIDHFVSYQLSMIEKVAEEISHKLQLIKSANRSTNGILEASIPAETTILKNKLRSPLSKVNLTVLLWWLAESELLECEKSHDYFVKFVEDNVQYFDKSKKIYADMKDIGPLMSKLIKSVETNPTDARQMLLETLQNTKLPPDPITESKLTKNKWAK